MINNIKILDCTLRDGGYYTNWDFERNLWRTYFKELNNLPIHYLEIGYRNNPQKGYFGEFYFLPLYIVNQIVEISNKPLAIILNEKDVEIKDVKRLIYPLIGLIKMVRIAVDPNRLKSAVKLAEEIKKYDFEVSFNVMYMSKWHEVKEFSSNLKLVNGIVDFFYMVDSYGGIYPSEVKERTLMLKSEISSELGFHGHNNLELALINTLTAIENGATIIDATITGMGRGAGNLKTELLLSALNSKFHFPVDFNALSSIVSIFTELQNKYNWGTNLPYMVSGANSLPQKEVMEWTSKRYYSINSIVRALNNQKQGMEDNKKYPIFNVKHKTKQVLIIGGGPTVINLKDSIIEFINKFKEGIVLIHSSSRNAEIFSNLKIQQYFCLVGNEGVRLDQTVQNFNTEYSTCILPPFPRKMGTNVPQKVESVTKELKAINFTELLGDTHTALALQTAKEIDPEKIFIVGYDGYSGIEVSSKEMELLGENETLFNKFKLNTNKKLLSISPTVYKELIEDSVFNYLI